MNSLGIYFGAKDINLVEVSGKKILNNVRLPHPKLEISELEAKVPLDVKITALLKDAFRTYHINANEATFSISGLDLVIRTFEIPPLPKSEIKGAINFEAKKYIPFKLDDLDFDSQVFFDNKSKSNLVLFVGIKKEILADYISLAKQLNLKINAIEYSAFSILRFLKLSGLSSAGVIATLCFDLKNESEANLTVFENGFSLFSRDFNIVQEPVGFEQAPEAGLLQQLDKLKNEIKISLDYYKRKFPEKEVKNTFIVSDEESYAGLQSFFAESKIPTKLVEIQKALGKTASYSSILVKSFAAATFKSVSLGVKINLVGTRLKAAQTTSFMANPLALFKGIKLDFKYIFLGIFICGTVFGIGFMGRKAKQQELDATLSQRVEITSVPATAEQQELTDIGAQYEEKIRSLENSVKNQFYLTPLLSAIPQALPKGVWLESIILDRPKEAPVQLIINGQVDMENDSEEFEQINIFLNNLKKDKSFPVYFNEIIIGFIDRRTVRDRDISVFTITCKNLPEKK